MPTISKLMKSRGVLLAGVALVGLLTGGAVLAESGFVASEPVQIQAENQAPIVNVRTVTPRKVQVWSSFSGRLKAVDSAELRPEVSGRITEIHFRDGDLVKRGDILFVIDPRSYEAAVAKAKADLLSAQTVATLAAGELQRAAKLVATKNLSRSVYDQRNNAERVARAGVAAAEAALAEAEVNVDHAYMKAPIDGRISRPEITIGNLVQTGPGAPLLASIVSSGSIYADFEVDEQTYLNSRRTDGVSPAIPVELTLQDDGQRVYRGTLTSFDNQIDTASGTIRARARFENADAGLVPGMFVSVKLAASEDAVALTVPERAIGTDQDKKFLYVVDGESKAVSREITLGAAVEDERIVLSGLNAGDRVILEGVQHITPGAPVRVEKAVADLSLGRR
ncbi:Multidrug resistance protein MdtE [Alphaproteobacteria bacterium SO-S41]|nr:Multidrug resistance protein MdtE [Alphaproteobacteria bacterium SO-S41]